MMQDVGEETLLLMSATYKTSIFEQHLSYLKFDYEKRVALLIEERRYLTCQISGTPTASFNRLVRLDQKI